MKKNKIAAYLMTLALVAILVAGCGGENGNNRNIGTNANANANANRPQTANANNSNTSTIAVPSLEQLKEEAKRLGAKVGDKAEDTVIWGQIRAMFTADSELRDVNVDVENGVVTLGGTVATAAAKAKAKQKAEGVSGVKSVTDNIKISPTS